MANNPYNNIVKLSDGTTIMDITDTTATASDVAQGKYFYAATGEKTLGTASGGGGGAVVVIDEQLPGGGTAKHITAVDISDTTAVASDVAQGKYFYTSSGVKTAGTASGGSITVNSLSVTQNGTYTAPTGTAYSPVTVNVSGGGGGSAEPKDVNFFDYDGTIVYSYSRTDALALDALPSNPFHTGLTAQGWNWSLTNIKSYLNKYSDATVNVGQMYITDDGKTRLYVHLEEERKSPWLQLYPKGTVVIDWGDNTATDTLTGTSISTIKNVQHVYAHGGDYIITLTVTGTARIQGSSSTGNGSYLLQKVSGTNSAYVSQVYRNSVRKIEFGSGIELYSYSLKNMQSLEKVTLPKYMTSIGTYAFYNCYSITSLNIPDGVTSIGTYTFQTCPSLVSITIPDGITSIGNDAFEYCYSLASITIPDGITNIGSYAFGYCYSLASVTIPDGITSIGDYTFQTCPSLVSITIPDGITSIGSYAFNNCQSFTSVVIPDGVTSMGGSAFQNCYGMAEYHFLPTTPPTLGSSAFSGLPSDCIIYVPQASLSDYQTATNWSTYASYMQGE